MELTTTTKNKTHSATIQAGVNSDDDNKTTTSRIKKTQDEDDTGRRILVKTIIKAKRNGRRRSSKSLDNDRKKDKLTTTKVKVYRRKLEISTSATIPREGEEREVDHIPMSEKRRRVVKKNPIKKKSKQQQQRKQKILKRKIEKSIETEVQVKTRPRTYTYFVTRKHGDGPGSEEFVSSSTEVRQFTYSVTVSKTLYRTENEHQVRMTSLVEPTF